MNLASGTRLGRYEVRELLGAGGMGEVYLARDHDLERDVAIKVLRNAAEAGSDRVRRFVQEARAASGLHHPNVAHVYEIGTHDDFRFIAMELVEGETLRARMRRGAMPVDDAIEIATQIAAALGAAHQAGIVHRDIKPENVILTHDGYAKVLDFGLAKLRDSRGDEASTLLMTTPGVTMGTIGYSAPEQLVGGDITPASDVFSLGVVVYEMLAGRRPFEGTSTTDVVSAILSKAPRPLREARPEVPPKLEAIVMKALAKVVEERYPDAGEMHEALRALSRERMTVSSVSENAPKKKRALAIGIVVGLLAIAGAAGWLQLRVVRRREATRQIAAAEKLVEQRKLAEAYETALAAAAVLPDNPRVLDVISRTSGRLKIESDPPGATVFLQRYGGPPQRVRMGVTPLTIPRLVRADYLMTLEKSGYTAGVRTISTVPLYLRGEPFLAETPAMRMKLAPASQVPSGMVLVEGGSYRLSGFARPSDRVVELSDFFIDRTEVSNQEFEQFIRDGGYRRPELWKHPFVDGAATLTLDEAMARFRDTTGLPGPRDWSGGAPPAGRENHPVTGVTWYEAAAFAEWKGKKLPTVYQWEKAARPPGVNVANSFPWGMVGEGVDATERANFLGKGTMPVDSMPFGAGPSGSLHMAGNVSEWCRNAIEPGHAARGGGWSDNVYAFGQTAAYPPFYSAPTLGFRCAAGGSGDEGDFTLAARESSPVYEPVSDAAFEQFRRRYDYKREPLQARVVETVDTPDWRREKIEYVSGGKVVPAYLYTPKGFRRPLQVIQFAPAGDVVNGWRTLPHSIEISLAPIIRGGRAVFSVVLEGFLGRPHPAGWVNPDPEQDEYVATTVERVTEMRRGLDYIESRPDLDASRIALWGPSAGGGPGVLVTAIDSRYRSVVLVGSGIGRREKTFAPAANRINFAPHIRAPKLMLQGRYDEDTPLKEESEPLFRLLREPKRFVIYEGAHVPPAEISMPLITKWLDETMGPVGR